MSTSQEEVGPRTGHLGTAWEIAVVTIFVALVFIIVGTVVFQIRRKQRRQRQEALDAELGSQKDSLDVVIDSRQSDKRNSTLSVPQPTASSHRHSKTSLSYPDHPSKKPPRYYWDHR